MPAVPAVTADAVDRRPVPPPWSPLDEKWHGFAWNAQSKSVMPAVRLTAAGCPHVAYDGYPQVTHGGLTQAAQGGHPQAAHGRRPQTFRLDDVELEEAEVDFFPAAFDHDVYSRADHGGHPRADHGGHPQAAHGGHPQAAHGGHSQAELAAMFKDVDDMASRLDVSESGIWTQLVILRATADVATYACEQEPSVTMDPIGNVLSLMQNVLAMGTLGAAVQDELAEGVQEADVKLTADALPSTVCELDGPDGIPLASKTLKEYYAKADVQSGSACQCTQPEAWKQRWIGNEPKPPRSSYLACAGDEAKSKFTEFSRPVPAG